MEAPPKLLQLLKLACDQLYLAEKSDVVLFDLPDLAPHGISDTDVKYIVNFLMIQKLVTRRIFRQIPDDSLHPVQPKYRTKCLDFWPGFVACMFSDHTHGQWVFQVSSRDEFFDFYRCQVSGEKLGIVTYDSLNGVVGYNGRTYRIESVQRKKLFGVLWDLKEPLPKEAVAVQADFIRESRDFPNVKTNFKQEISQLNRNFRAKSFPLKITTRGGVLMKK